MRWRQLMVGVAVTVAVMAPAGQALAHAGLESSEPSANAVLETGPPNIVLDFNEAVDARISSIELFDQDATADTDRRPREWHRRHGRAGLGSDDR